MKVLDQQGTFSQLCMKHLALLKVRPENMFYKLIPQATLKLNVEKLYSFNTGNSLDNFHMSVENVNLDTLYLGDLRNLDGTHSQDFCPM